MRLRILYFESIYIIAAFMIFMFVFFDFFPFGDSWVIPDSYSLINTAKVTQNISFFDVFNYYKSSWLLFAFNKIIYSISAFGFVFFNVAIIIFAFFAYHKKRRFCIFVLAMTPFFLLNTPLPSKDLVVLLLFSLWCNAVVNNNGLVRLFLISSLMFLVRDGFGIILLFMSIQSRFTVFDKINPYIHVAVLFLFGCIISEVIKYFTADFFLLSRVSAIAEKSEQVNYILRVFGTLTNFAARNPVLTSRDTLNIVFSSYAISGVMVVCSFFVSASMLRSSVLLDRKLAISFFTALFLISISPLVQSRYMISLVVVLTYYTNIPLLKLLRFYIIACLLSLFLFSMYYYMGILPVNPPPENANMSLFY